MSRVDETIPAAWSDVLAERRRQVEAEGWTPEHDDEHRHGEVASAAACYALSSLSHNEGSASSADLRRMHFIGEEWPWQNSWYRPSTRRRDLVKAGALILAEIERLDRASALIAKEGEDADRR